MGVGTPQIKLNRCSAVVTVSQKTPVVSAQSPAQISRVRQIARALFLRFSRSEQQKRIGHLTRLVERVLANQKQDEKWRIIFRRQLNAVIRHLYISGSDIPAPNALAVHRFRLRSQNEEDGIILVLLQAAGVVGRRFVEIGCGRSGGNSAMLAHELGWSGLMVDASRKAIASLQKTFKANPGVVAVRARVAPDTLNELLSHYGMTGEIDFLSIDIDSVDYWLLDALAVCSPRVLVTEYNAHFGPERMVTVPNGSLPADAPKGYSGASLAALEKLARRKNYRLVLCEDAGVNAFFLRNDLAPEVPGLTPAQGFRPMVDKRDVSEQRLKEVDLYRVIDERGLPLIEV